MEENKNLEKIKDENTEKVSGGYSVYTKTNLGNFKSDNPNYKSRNIHCDFCFRNMQGKGILSFEGKDICLECYKKLCLLDLQKVNLKTREVEFNNTGEKNIKK